MPRITGNLATSLVLNHQINTRTRFGDLEHFAARAALRRLLAGGIA
jgi:hypothetical protein